MKITNFPSTKYIRLHENPIDGEENMLQSTKYIRLYENPFIGEENSLPKNGFCSKRNWLLAFFITIFLVFFSLIFLNKNELKIVIESYMENAISLSNSYDKFSSVDFELDDKTRIEHKKRRFPQCIIIGTRKSGTRALLTFLNLHPQINICKEEMHFFDSDDNYSMGLEWYRKQMPFTYLKEVTIEKTPGYFKSEEAPHRIYKMNSTIKLLVIVKDPVVRAVSDYLQIHLNKEEKHKPDSKFENHVLLQDGDIDFSYNPVQRSIYVNYIRKWLSWFPLEQFHFVNGDNILIDPLHELHSVEKFLNLKHSITKDNFYFNETKGFYCVKDSIEEKCLAESKGREHPPINPIVENKLRDYFRPFNLKFYDLIDIDFGWR